MCVNQIIEKLNWYLQGTEEYGIFFSANHQVFTDANYGEHDTDMNSTSRIYRGPIIWAAQKQSDSYINRRS